MLFPKTTGNATLFEESIILIRNASKHEHNSIYLQCLRKVGLDTSSTEHAIFGSANP